MFHSALSSKIRTSAFFLLACGLLLASSPALASKHLILISVDGLGAELFNQTSMPHLKALAARGEQAEVSRTTRPVATIPGHVSMISGVPPEIHKSVWNENDKNLIPATVPNLFDLFKANALTSVFVTGKAKLKKIFEDHPPTETILPSAFPFGETWGRFPGVVDSRAIKAMETKPDLLFVHYALADTIGHAVGWESWLQKTALARIDDSIQRLLDAAEKTYGQDGYVVVVTADHGGHEASHGRTNPDGSLQDEKRDLFIPWIVYGAKLLDSKAPVSIIDTAPSLACLVGLEAPAEWNWQGQNRLEGSCQKLN